MTDSDHLPTFGTVKEALHKRGFTWEREQPFENDDLTHGIFRGKSDDGRKVFAPADYDDDERIEPEIVDNICRGLGIDSKTLRLDCGNGHQVSVRPAPRMPTPPSRPALRPGQKH